MESGILTDDEETVLTVDEEEMASMNEEEQTYKEGTERDIMQVVEIMRDSLAVHAIVHDLRGIDRNRVEKALAALPEFPEKEGTERDIMQFTDAEPALLGPEAYRALNHLLGNRSSFLRALVRLAKRDYDWRKLPSPVQS